MSLGYDILRKLSRRLGQSETRLRAAEQRLKRTMQTVQQMVHNKSAQLAAPGSPALILQERFVAKITGIQDEANRIYQAVRQEPIGWGTWQNDADEPDTILVRTVANAAGIAPSLSVGDRVWIEWVGGDDAQQYYYVMSGVGGGGTTLVTIKFDGTRTGKRYTGHLVNDGGTLGDQVQFRFVNDPGTDTLIDANYYLTHCRAIQTWDATNACWSGTLAKYWAILSPDAMVA